MLLILPAALLPPGFLPLLLTLRETTICGFAVVPVGAALAFTAVVVSRRRGRRGRAAATKQPAEPTIRGCLFRLGLFR